MLSGGKVVSICKCGELWEEPVVLPVEHGSPKLVVSLSELSLGRCESEGARVQSG